MAGINQLILHRINGLVNVTPFKPYSFLNSYAICTLPFHHQILIPFFIFLWSLYHSLHCMLLLITYHLPFMAYHKAYCNLLLLLFFTLAMPSLADDRQVLMQFRGFLSNAGALNNWGDDSIDLCKWTGIICRQDAFHGLKLESMGLSGTIDINTLVGLSNMQSFSVKNNSFEGPMPEFNKLRRLKALFLSNNKFSQDIPDNAFEGIRFLKKVFLAENEFTGHIPKSLADLSNLQFLDLHGNRFEGNIPEFKNHDNIKEFNVSNNLLEGEIPGNLNINDLSSVAGNKGLCGKPLNPCRKHSKKNNILIIALVVVGVIALASIIAILFVLRRRRRKSQAQSKPSEEIKSLESGGLMMKKEAPQSVDLSVTADLKKVGNGDLNFVKEDREKFDLQELLRAPAEVLGSGSFGSTYKAIVLNGPAMVVKRFRQMNNVGKEEFFEHMKRLGSLSHPNLLPLVAFYYRKEEKLLVYDFVENGSLASHLHGRRGSGLDWPTRLRIIKGVARGLAYLYTEFPGENLPHGHLKSSNVLLDESLEPRLTEYGLVPVMNKNHAQQFMASYKAPEVSQMDRPNEKTDVWCLGILILELLTGKFPANYLRHGKGENSDLATWVNSVVREEWTGEVFDKDISGTRNGEAQMLRLLKIGMYCCEWGVENRWDWKEAVAKIEELKEKDSEDELSSFNSDGDLHSRPMTEEDFSFTASK